MRRVTAWSTGLVLVLGSGCPEDREPTATSAPGSTGTPSTGSSGSGESTATPVDSTGMGWPLPTEDDLMTCVRTCELPADCCPASSAGLCPSSQYPYNYACIDGLCVFPPCVADAECQGEGEVCREVRGLPSCVVPCDGDDAPCMAIDPAQTCSGMTDDGSGFCLAHCSDTNACFNTSCDETNGVCVCSSAGQCLSGEECV